MWFAGIKTFIVTCIVSSIRHTDTFIVITAPFRTSPQFSLTLKKLPDRQTYKSLSVIRLRRCLSLYLQHRGNAGIEQITGFPGQHHKSSLIGHNDFSSHNHHFCRNQKLNEPFMNKTKTKFYRMSWEDHL
jgi:hypothetical protein